MPNHSPVTKQVIVCPKIRYVSALTGEYTDLPFLLEPDYRLHNAVRLHGRSHEPVRPAP
jgi:hypothetical protein